MCVCVCVCVCPHLWFVGRARMVAGPGPEPSGDPGAARGLGGEFQEEAEAGGWKMEEGGGWFGWKGRVGGSGVGRGI